MSDDAVREQYEAYPYPARDPAEEAERLIVGSPGNLPELNHYVFGGRLDLTQPLRVLFAGGGTGDGTIMLAQQLHDAGCPAEVVYIDVSKSSRAIAEARAAARGLTNISFNTLSLLDLPFAGLGTFDYIDCCGVLHHLDDPAAGLKALTSVLKPTGGLGLMVYGELGRTGVYDLQETLRTLKPDGAPGERVAFTKKLIRDLPPSNRFKNNKTIADHESGDAELHDLLLNARDRAYTVPQIFELTDSLGLEVTAFVKPINYDPAIYFEDDDILDRIDALDWRQRCAIGELISGDAKIHIFYAVPAARKSEAVAQPCPEAVPSFFQLDHTALAAGMKPGLAKTFSFTGVTVTHVFPDMAGDIIALMDGQRSLGEIQAILQSQDPDLDWEFFDAIFGVIYAIFQPGGALFLKIK